MEVIYIHLLLDQNKDTIRHCYQVNWLTFFEN